MTQATAFRRIIRTARDERVWRAGWWLLPAIIGGAAGWIALIWAVVT